MQGVRSQGLNEVPLTGCLRVVARLVQQELSMMTLAPLLIVCDARRVGFSRSLDTVLVNRVLLDPFPMSAGR